MASLWTEPKELDLSRRGIRKVRIRVQEHLRQEYGFHTGAKISDELLAQFAEEKLGLKRPNKGDPYSSPAGRIRRASAKILGQPLALPKGKPTKPDRIKAFYRSYEWAQARMAVLERNDGRCECCGRSKHDGATLNVDHIKPLKFFWDLRTDTDNLQVLCGLCNKGKGNRHMTDWRRKCDEPDLGKLMGEKI